MGISDAKSRYALGFLAVVEHPQHGLAGGYLVLNRSARPLEFHCTAPLKPNRAQEILYGPTLKPFLYGEQIGQTLLSKSTIEPAVIFVDQEPSLAVSEYSTAPIVLVMPELGEHGAAAATGPSSTLLYRMDAMHGSGAPLAYFSRGHNRLAIAGADDGLCQQVIERLVPVGDSFDLAEPFGRIREAIEEAQRAAR